MKPTAKIIPVVLGALLFAPTITSAETPVVTAVFSRTARNYKRTVLPDGTFKREEYVIANGKYSPGAAPNASIDKVEFPQIAGLVAQYLAKKNYYLADKADTATLLLMITWGTTIPFSDGTRPDALANLSSAAIAARGAQAKLDAAMAASMQVSGGPQSTGDAVRQAQEEANLANDALQSQLTQMQLLESGQNKTNDNNARLLGYIDELSERNDASRFAGAGAGYDDLVSDIQAERYYITITAYDFKKLRETKKQVPLWSTRVSVEARNTRFDESLAVMVAAAGQHFGQDSGRLVRESQEGKVRLGDVKYLGVKDDAPATPAKPAEKK
ncbi:MAG TPA: hypothetical protein VG734_17250 [Lacunisphaera sp.]|nr:hypothetical protein [Lacunisphaera sp.]